MQRKHADDVNLAALRRGVQRRAVHLAARKHVSPGGDHNITF